MNQKQQSKVKFDKYDIVKFENDSSDLFITYSYENDYIYRYSNEYFNEYIDLRTLQWQNQQGYNKKKKEKENSLERMIQQQQKEAKALEDLDIFSDAFMSSLESFLRNKNCPVRNVYFSFKTHHHDGMMNFEKKAFQRFFSIFSKSETIKDITLYFRVRSDELNYLITYIENNKIIETLRLMLKINNTDVTYTGKKELLKSLINSSVVNLYLDGDTTKSIFHPFEQSEFKNILILLELKSLTLDFLPPPSPISSLYWNTPPEFYQNREETSVQDSVKKLIKFLQDNIFLSKITYIPKTGQPKQFVTINEVFQILFPIYELETHFMATFETYFKDVKVKLPEEIIRKIYKYSPKSIKNVKNKEIIKDFFDWCIEVYKVIQNDATKKLGTYIYQIEDRKKVLSVKEQVLKITKYIPYFTTRLELYFETKNKYQQEQKLKSKQQRQQSKQKQKQQQKQQQQQQSKQKQQQKLKSKQKQKQKQQQQSKQKQKQQQQQQSKQKQQQQQQSKQKK